MKILNNIIYGAEKAFKNIDKLRPQAHSCALNAITESQKHAELAVSSNNPIKTAQLLSPEDVAASKKAVVLINFFKSLPELQLMGEKPTLTGSLIEQADQIRSWIRQPAAKEIRFLDLSGKSLNALPPEIGEFTSLKIITLADNKLTELPPEIGLLTQLCGLSVANNKLTTLPEEITKLDMLEDLILSHNALSGELSGIVTELPKLELLRIDNNKLTSFPLGMGRLKSMKSIFYHGNAIGMQLSPVVHKQYLEQSKAYGKRETEEQDKRTEQIVAAEQAIKNQSVDQDTSDAPKAHSLYDGEVVIRELEETASVEAENSDESKAHSFYDGDMVISEKSPTVDAEAPKSRSFYGGYTS